MKKTLDRIEINVGDETFPIGDILRAIINNRSNSKIDIVLVYKNRTMVDTEMMSIALAGAIAGRMPDSNILIYSKYRYYLISHGTISICDMIRVICADIIIVNQPASDGVLAEMSRCTIRSDINIRLFI